MELCCDRPGCDEAKAIGEWTADQLWIVVALKDQLFAIPADGVRTMVLAPRARPVPGTPTYVRGIATLRDESMPLVDLRCRLGLKSLAEETEEFCALMGQREQDHRNWLNALESTVKGGTEFKLATDPHKCAFGKWYDQYHSDSLMVAGILKQFDAPHQRIHGIAEQCLGLVEQGRREEAVAIIDACRDGDLARMIALFGELKALFAESSRELAIAVESDAHMYAVTVDTVEWVGRLEPGSLTSVDALPLASMGNDLVSFVGRNSKDERLVLGLDTGKILRVGTA